MLLLLLLLLLLSACILDIVHAFSQQPQFDVCCSVQGIGAWSDSDVKLQVYSKEVKTISCKLTATTEPAVTNH